MSYDKDLDEEIDRELGWDSGRAARLRHAAQDPLMVRLARSAPSRLLRTFTRGLLRVVFFPIFSPSAYNKRFDINGNVVMVKRSVPWRLVDGLMVRTLLTPVIVALFFLGLVWQTTHPKPVLAIETPAARAMYFKRVGMTCADGQEIQGWLIPPYSAEQVVLEREAVITRRYPAVVLAHGLGFSHEQYLTLAQQLHQAACTVLMVDTRGQGESPAAAVTFGVRERLDIAAAINYVRDLSYSDAAKLGIVGYGSSGVAALHAVAVDPSISAVVADSVRMSFSDDLATSLDNPIVPAKYLIGPYEITFEMLMRERLGFLNLGPVVSSIRHTSLLLISRPQTPADPCIAEAAALASTAGGPHRVLTCSGPAAAGELSAADAARVTEFFCQNLHWTGGERSAAVEELLRARLK